MRWCGDCRAQHCKSSRQYLIGCWFCHHFDLLGQTGTQRRRIESRVYSPKHCQWPSVCCYIFIVTTIMLISGVKQFSFLSPSFAKKYWMRLRFFGRSVINKCINFTVKNSFLFIVQREDKRLDSKEFACMNSRSELSSFIRTLANRIREEEWPKRWARLTCSAGLNKLYYYVPLWPVTLFSHNNKNLLDARP